MDRYKIIGKQLRDKRKALGITLKEVATRVGVSENYVSEIERGTGKIPSDDLLSSLAKVYMVDELELFESFGKLPKGVVNQLESNETLKRTLYELDKDGNLSCKEKLEINKEIERLYNKLLQKKKK